MSPCLRGLFERPEVAAALLRAWSGRPTTATLREYGVRRGRGRPVHAPAAGRRDLIRALRDWTFFDRTRLIDRLLTPSEIALLLAILAVPNPARGRDARKPGALRRYSAAAERWFHKRRSRAIR